MSAVIIALTIGQFVIHTVIIQEIVDASCLILLIKIFLPQITGSYNDYYRDALRFLGCVELNTMAGQF